MNRDLAGLTAHRDEYRDSLERVGTLPAALENWVARFGRPVNTAGRLAPLHFPDEEMRRLQNAVQRGEPCRIEHRDFSTADDLLPSSLFPTPIEFQHEGRLLAALPGYAMSAPSITFIRHVSTTGAPAPTAEGAVKPEVVFETDALTATAVKIAAHNAISQEIASDWPAFQSYCGGELYRAITDTENDQILNGDGNTGSMVGFYETPNILTHTSTVVGSDTHIDSIEEAITKLRVGPALATCDLIVLHPETWSAIRRTKDGQDRYMVAPDPTTDEANQLWGVSVLSTTANPVGTGLLIDTRKFGYVGVRESLSMRVGYANDDLTRNLIRTVGEERLVLCVTRPAAVVAISGLPTAAATASKSTATKK